MNKENQKLSILILEDNIDLASQWMHFFRKEGMTVRHAMTVDEAVIHCNQINFDAIVLDIFLKNSEGKLMPRAGITLLSYIRNTSLEKIPKWGATVPIVIVTGASAKLGFDPLLNAKSIGGSRSTEVLRKPFKPIVLHDMLMDLIKNNQESE